MELSGDVQELPVIDFHAHAFPDKIAKPAIEQLVSHYKVNVARTGTYCDLIDSAGEAGVAQICLHMAATGAEQVEITNDWIAHQCSEKVNGFGSLHADYPEYLKELDRMEALGLLGIKFHAEFQGFAIDDPRMWPVYEAIGDRFMVMFHVGDKESDLSNPIRLKRVVKAFPGMMVIAAHLGGWSKWQEARENILGQDVYIDTSSTTWVLEPDEIAGLIRKHDSNKVLFGTDYPIVSHRQELAAFARVPLKEEERTKILWKNAELLLKRFRSKRKV